MLENDLYVIAMPIFFTLTEVHNTIIQFSNVFRVQGNARTVDYLCYNKKEDVL